MQHKDLKDTFCFKTLCGTSPETYKAYKVSKHIWRISSDRDDMSSDLYYDDFLDYLNDGNWVIQEEEDMAKSTEQKPQQETAIEVKTLRDEFAMVALQGWIAAKPNIANAPLDGTEDHAKLMAGVAYRYADAMMKVRKEPL